MSPSDEPKDQAGKSQTSPNFLGKLWKAQAPSASASALAAKSKAASNSTSALDSTSTSNSTSTLNSTATSASVHAPASAEPALRPGSDTALSAEDYQESAQEPTSAEAGGTEEDSKVAQSSKFLSKLWKAQKSSGNFNSLNESADKKITESTVNDTDGDRVKDDEEPPYNKAVDTEPVVARAVGAGTIETETDNQNSTASSVQPALEKSDGAQREASLAEIQESLKIDEAALPAELAQPLQTVEPVQPVQPVQPVEPVQSVQQREVTQFEDPKAKRKAALKAYDVMKEEQRLKTERGNTVRTPTLQTSALSIGPAGSNASSNANLGSGSDSEPSLDTLNPNPDSDSDSEPATTTSTTSTISIAPTTPIVTAGEANPDALVTRQSFANTVAASPSNAPQTESAAAARHFVRKHPLSVALVIAMVAAGIAYYPTENALSNLHSGEELLEHGDPPGALTKLTRAISSNPHLGAAYIARARAYSQTGASNLALADCDKAIGLQPDKPEGYEQRANIELPLGRFRQTIADLESVSRITGTNTPAALLTLGRAYLGDGQYSRALTQFSKKLDREPDDVQSIVAKAQCYQAMNRPHTAIASCDAAIFKAGNTYDAYVLRGQCEDQLNNRTSALHDFGKAITIDGQRADAFLSRALLYANTGDFTKAMQDLDIGIKLPGGIPDGLYKRALVYALQHDRNNALKQFQLLEAKPNYTADNWFLIQRSDVYAQLQDYKMDKADLEKALSSDKSYQTACWLRLARCYEFEKDYKKAAFYASKVLANEPTNTTALLKHSEYSLLSGNRMTGLADLFKVIEVDPKNVMAYSNRGDLYVADKQFNLADDDYQKASQLAPLNTEIKKKLAVCNALIRRPKLTIQSATDKPPTLSAAALKEIAESNLQTLKQKGYEALKSGHGEYAVAALTRAIYLNPNDGNSRRYLAYALLKTGNTADATQQFYAWEKTAQPDPSAEMAFVKSLAAQVDAAAVFEQLAEKYRMNASVLLEIARQCAFYGYHSVAASALDFATKVATSDEQVAVSRLKISLEHSSGKDAGALEAPGAVPMGKAHIAN